MKVTICFSEETPVDTNLPLYGYTTCDFRSHSEEVFILAGMNDFHRRIVAGIAVTATRVSAILNVNRDKKRKISLPVSSKDRKYRADKMAAQIVADIISKEKTTRQVSFAGEELDLIKDVSMPRTFLSKNRHSSTT